MNVRPKRRKCRSCNDFFFPDFRNQDRQHYCSKPECRQASKRASQERWLRQPANRDYFRGLSRTCSECGTGARPIRAIGRRGHLRLERLKPLIHSGLTQSRSLVTHRSSPLGTLQDSCLPKDPGFIGLVAMITGATLQEDIAATARRVVERGRHILGLNLPGKRPSTYDLQTSASGGSPAANPAQL